MAQVGFVSRAVAADVSAAAESGNGEEKAEKGEQRGPRACVACIAIYWQCGLRYCACFYRLTLLQDVTTQVEV
eukprot:scaffold2751_cov101-Skeletonema_dohrnii-CCMP3373.AAC.2